MILPYENATSGSNALNDIQKMLRAFGCQRFGTGEDYETGELFIVFAHRGRQVRLKASSNGYAATWLRARPYSCRLRASEADTYSVIRKASPLSTIQVVQLMASLATAEQRICVQHAETLTHQFVDNAPVFLAFYVFGCAICPVSIPPKLTPDNLHAPNRASESGRYLC